MFPEVTVGVVIACELDNDGEDLQITELLRKQQGEALASLSGAPLSQHPAIIVWRQAYAKFGAKPKKYRSSIESLFSRLTGGQEVANINKLVNLYNAVSLQYALPVGGEDLDQIQGDILLTRAGENEPLIRLLGDAEEKAPKPGEVIYTDQAGAICRRWNWREAERTKLTKQTRNAVLVVEALNRQQREALEAEITRLGDLTQRYCGGTVKREILSADHPALQIAC
jgi:DNA/RNA-binding domain of Phe-tRNA-synthetase-like protein